MGNRMRPYHQAYVAREEESSRRLREIESLKQAGKKEEAREARVDWCQWREESGLALRRIRKECASQATSDSVT